MAIDWYKGDVPSAVAKAKTEHASLMVFVAWDDEYSKFYEKVLKSLNMSDKLYVAVRIEAYSDGFEQLKAVYRIVPVPCVLIIDWESGMVMERVAGPVFDEELQEALLAAIPSRPPQEKEPSPEPPLQTSSEAKPPETKIQFKLASGESKMHVFAPDDTLEDLRKQAKTLFKLTTPFELAVPYPRRPLRENLNAVTLESLSLCPASAILIIPREENALLPWSVLQSLGRQIEPILVLFRSWWQRIFNTGPKPTPTTAKKTN